MDITYGCECKDCFNHHGENNAPCAFIIERNGKELKVCTRCDLSSDKLVARLFDENTSGAPFFEYDALGAFCMMDFVDDKVWEERKAYKLLSREEQLKQLRETIEGIKKENKND